MASASSTGPPYVLLTSSTPRNAFTAANAACGGGRFAGEVNLGLTASSSVPNNGNMLLIANVIAVPGGTVLGGAPGVTIGRVAVVAAGTVVNDCAFAAGTPTPGVTYLTMRDSRNPLAMSNGAQAHAEVWYLKNPPAGKYDGSDFRVMGFWYEDDLVGETAMGAAGSLFVNNVDNDAGGLSLIGALVGGGGVGVFQGTTYIYQSASVPSGFGVVSLLVMSPDQTEAAWPCPGGTTCLEPTTGTYGTGGIQTSLIGDGVLASAAAQVTVNPTHLTQTLGNAWTPSLNGIANQYAMLSYLVDGFGQNAGGGLPTGGGMTVGVDMTWFILLEAVFALSGVALAGSYFLQIPLGRVRVALFVAFFVSGFGLLWLLYGAH